MPNIILSAPQPDAKQKLQEAPDYIRNKRKIGVYTTSAELNAADLSEYSEGDILLLTSSAIFGGGS